LPDAYYLLSNLAIKGMKIRKLNALDRASNLEQVALFPMLPPLAPARGYQPQNGDDKDKHRIVSYEL